MKTNRVPAPVQFGTVKHDEATRIRNPHSQITTKDLAALHEKRRQAKVVIVSRQLPWIRTGKREPGQIFAHLTLSLHMDDYRYHLRVNGKGWSHQDPCTCLGWDTLEDAVKFLNKVFLTD